MTILTSTNESVSCKSHFPHWDPCCLECAEKLRQAREEHAKLEASVVGVVMEDEPEESDVWPESLVDKPTGVNEDGSFTMCPEVWQQFKKFAKWTGWLSDGSRKGMEVDQLMKLLYKHQGLSFEQYT